MTGLYRHTCLKRVSFLNVLSILKNRDLDVTGMLPLDKKLFV